MEGFRFHDLRHTGQTLAAATGATVKDLQRRLGHSSTAAAMRYLQYRWILKSGRSADRSRPCPPPAKTPVTV
jgi:integrase